MKKENNSKYGRMERLIKDKLDKGDEVTIKDLMDEFFPKMHPTDARHMVGSYLHAFRKRKKHRFLVYPVIRGGKLVKINSDDSDTNDIEEVVSRHIGLLSSIFKNRHRDLSNDVVSPKIGFKVGDQLIQLGLEIMQDVRQIQNKIQSPATVNQQIAGGQESA